MNIITHFFASWSFAEIINLKEREKNILALGGVLPDLDGFGLIPDVICRTFNLTDRAYFGTYHHNLLHGIFGAILISLFLTFFTKSRFKTFFLLLLIVHLHFVMDIVGSRGPSPDEVWALNYLAPFSNSIQIVWKFQWQLNDIKNIIFTIFLMIFIIFRGIKYGNSPVSIFSKKANKIFIETIRKRAIQLKIIQGIL